MPHRRAFEHRLRAALLAFAVLPSLALVGLGGWVAVRALALSDSADAWERVAATGSELIRAAEASPDPALAAAAAAHRAELAASVTHARQWEYVGRRTVALVPVAGLVVAVVLGLLALRASRRIGGRLSRPVSELVSWAGIVGRREPLPPATAVAADDDDEFAVLRDAFRGMADELEASRRRELEAERTRTWVAMARRVAHELKNPLTPIRFAVRTLQPGQAERPAREREAVEVLAAESARLEDLARTFAQFGKLPDGPRAAVDLAEMLRYLARTHLPPGAGASLHLPPDLPHVTADHDALSRAFANLLLNAGDAVADAPDGGGTVEIAARAVDGWVEVTVRDTGPGIDGRYLERVWEPDFTTRARGSGLGLALVRQTVLAHGGRVWARNRAEGGAEFGIALPAAETSAPAPA